MSLNIRRAYAWRRRLIINTTPGGGSSTAPADATEFNGITAGGGGVAGTWRVVDGPADAATANGLMIVDAATRGARLVTPAAGFPADFQYADFSPCPAAFDVRRDYELRASVRLGNYVDGYGASFGFWVEQQAALGVGRTDVGATLAHATDGTRPVFGGLAFLSAVALGTVTDYRLVLRVRAATRTAEMWIDGVKIVTSNLGAADVTKRNFGFALGGIRDLTHPPKGRVWAFQLIQ